MSSALNNQIEKALAELRSTQESLEQAQNDLAARTSSATARGRALTVTVDGRGDVTDIVFHSSAYRAMAPAELAALLVDTINTARADANRAVLEAFAPLMPAVLPLEDMLAGTMNLDSMIDEAMRTAQAPFPGEPGFRAPAEAGEARS